ncbi:hypothetical protein AK812_SmicGene8551 [Symbiodinium microadriaticum]|uniref:Uncharacterized protein n=1 Tax=Symbiodinium microadriaticum TaxID=2951 RepID=A0A1Q9EKR6_SYMMI|nr:hypothetical protein AK812_SmicGene8551 [Symbiodinium microadriaticum]
MAPPTSPSPKRDRSRKAFVVEAFLCVLCCLVGAFYPTLLDWSKTALEREISVHHTQVTALQKQEGKGVQQFQREERPPQDLSDLQKCGAKAGHQMAQTDMLQLRTCLWQRPVRAWLEDVFDEWCSGSGS